VREPDPAGDASLPAASRLGGIVLIAGVLALVGVVLFLALREDESDGEEPTASGGASPAAAATPTPAPSAAALRVADTIRSERRPAGTPRAP